jgi:hypothetical protein
MVDLQLIIIGQKIALSYAGNNPCNGPPRALRTTCTESALGGDRMLKKIITWAVVLFVVFYIATQPTGAAGFVHHAFNGLHSAANSMARFVNSL